MRKLQKATILLVAPLLAMLASLSPVAALVGATVDITNGALTITGGEANETIEIDSEGDAGTSFRIKVTDGDGNTDEQVVDGITRNVVVVAGVNDHIRIGTRQGSTFPGSLTVRSSSGPGTTILADAEIGGDLVLSGAATTRVIRTNIGDDLIGTSGAGVMRTFLTDAVVGDLLQVRATGGGQIHVGATRSEARRTRITGGNLVDRVELMTSDLGVSPNINLGGGNDVLFLFADSTWTGNAPLNLGGGNDQVLIDDFIDDGVPVEEVRLGRMNLRLGVGDDTAFVRTPLTVAGTVVDGQGGTDSLRAGGLQDHPTSKASYRNFEDIEGGAPAPAVELDVSPAGDLAITSTAPLQYVRLEPVGDEMTVAYRPVGATTTETATVDGVTRHVTVDVDGEVRLGRVGQALVFPRNVTIFTQPGIETPVSVEAEINGNLKVVANGWVSVELVDTTVVGTFDVRAHANSRLAVVLVGADLGRTRIVGGQDRDTVRVLANVDLGTAPNINLGAGSDSLALEMSSWTGRLSVLGGSGDDEAFIFGALGRMRVLMGTGDDLLSIGVLPSDGAGSILQGDGGTDTLFYSAEPTAATVRTFEVQAEVV